MPGTRYRPASRKAGLGPDAGYTGQDDMILESLERSLDVRDRCVGLKKIKVGYTVTPYHRRTKEGRHIHYKGRAQ